MGEESAPKVARVEAASTESGAGSRTIEPFRALVHVNARGQGAARQAPRGACVAREEHPPIFQQTG
eukprot:3899489-Lingulodinium_polyedra.AAC.1